MESEALDSVDFMCVRTLKREMILVAVETWLF